MQRQDATKPDPVLIAFTRYALDMSRFSRGGGDISYGIRERYFWELISPDPKDPVYQQFATQFRSELHDRIMAPIYPIVFAIMTFAFLGAPRTTRQSRNFSIGSSITATFALRAAGFACSVIAVRDATAIAIQYAMLLVATAASLWIIIGGIVIEPPARVVEWIARMNLRLALAFRRTVPAS